MFFRSMEFNLTEKLSLSMVMRVLPMPISVMKKMFAFLPCNLAWHSFSVVMRSDVGGICTVERNSYDFACLCSREERVFIFEIYRSSEFPNMLSAVPLQ